MKAGHSYHTAANYEIQEASCWAEIFSSAHPELKHRLRIDVMELNGAKCIATGALDVLAYNRVLGLDRTRPFQREQLREIIAFYQNAGSQRFFIQIAPDAITPEIHQFLTEERFTHYNNWSKYVLHNTGPLQVPQTDLTVLHIDRQQTQQFGAVIRSAFVIEEDIGDLMTSPIGKPGWHFYLAMDGDMPVAAATMHHRGDSAYLALAGTTPQARKRGAQGLLITTRINDALAAGCHHIFSETAENLPDKPSASARNMEKYGFRLAYLRTNYIYKF